MIFKLKMAWAFIQKNWKMVGLAIWSVIVWFLSRRSSSAAITAMEANKESYETRIKSLKEQHAKEVKKREELSKTEKKKIKDIVEKAKDNPDEINEKIENLFGFISDS